MVPTSASHLPASVVARLVPRASGSDWTPEYEQGVLLWDAQPTEQAPGAAPPCDAPEAPELQAWVTRFAQAMVEVVAGHRPPAQLVRWTTRTVYRDLERRTRLAQRAASVTAGVPVQRSTLRPQVRSVHLCPVAADVIETSVHVRHGRRSRAVAMRFEESQGRWRCTAMEFS
jgi:hypothetical protein